MPPPKCPNQLACCPSDAELTALWEGTLAPESIAELEETFTRCTECPIRCNSLESHDSLILSLASQKETKSITSKGVESVIERVLGEPRSNTAGDERFTFLGMPDDPNYIGQLGGFLVEKKC